MRFAIYIRRGEETFDAIGEVPDQLRKRTLAVRGFDASGMMTGWEIVEGTNVEAAIERQFANAEAEYLHIHFAAPREARRAGPASELYSGRAIEITQHVVGQRRCDRGVAVNVLCSLGAHQVIQIDLIARGHHQGSFARLVHATEPTGEKWLAW